LKKAKNKQILSLFLIFFALLISCTAGDVQKVDAFLNSCIYALNKQDAQKFLACFAPEYADNFAPADLARQRIKEELGKDLAPSCRILARKITLTPGGVSVEQEFQLEGIVSGKKRSYREKEKLALKRAGEGWEIASGSSLYAIFAGRALEEDAISEVLAQRVRALQLKELKLFQALLDPEYNFRGKDFKKLQAEMADNFRNYDSIRLELDRPRVSFRGDRAEVVEGYRMKALYRGQRLEFNDTEKLELRRTPQGWKISKGL